MKVRCHVSVIQHFRSSTDHGQLVNPTYEGDDLLHLQPSGSVPAYETIPPHPRNGARLEFIEQGENGYHVRGREQRANPETATTTHRMEMILEDSREESYSKLELREESGSSKKTSDEGIDEYSRLERVNIGSSTQEVIIGTIKSVIGRVCKPHSVKSPMYIHTHIVIFRYVS